MVNRLVLQRGAVRKVAQDGEGEVEGGLVELGQVELVDRAQQAGVGVGIAAEAQPQPLHGGDELAALEVAAAVKDHVLEEVRDALVALVLVERARVDKEPQAAAPGGFGGVADDVAQPVGQAPAEQLGILSERRLGLSLRGGGGRGILRRQRRQQTEQQEQGKGGVGGVHGG